MKKIYNILAIAAAGVMLFACTEKEDTYTPGVAEDTNCTRISFPKQTVCDYELDPEDASANTVRIEAIRKGDVTEGVTVPLVVTQLPADSAFVFTHTDLVFEAGKDTASFTVSFPEAQIGVEYTCHVMVADPKFGSVYTRDTTYFSFSFLKVKWTTIAKGTYYSGRYGAIPDIPLQACETFPGRYRFTTDLFAEPLVFSVYGKEKQGQGYTYYNFSFTAPNSGDWRSNYGEYIYVYSAAEWYGNSGYNDDYTEFSPSSLYWAAYVVYGISAGSFKAGWDEWEGTAI